ncbi:CZB domain-containing protein [Salmonella enterica subsp. enterica serovar Newport]
MASENTERLQYIYRLQQSKLVSISHMTENLTSIRENLETFSTEQKALAGELENCTNVCRRTIRRLEKKDSMEESEEKTEDGSKSLSPARKKSFLQAMRDVHDMSSSAAGNIYRISASQKHSAELLDLSVIMVKHFLWRERIFMALILGGHDNEALKQVSVRNCALGRWYDGRGKEAYSHLPAYRTLGEVHCRYHRVINELIDRGMEGIAFSELSVELAKLELLSQQLVGLIGQIHHHVALLQNSPE